MRKLQYFALILLTSISANAQNINLQQPATELNNQLKALFPIVAGILFIIVALVNLGHFTKDGGDWKKGLFNIILFVVVLSVIVGLYTYITSISL